MNLEKEEFILASLSNNLFCNGFVCKHNQTNICVCVSKKYATHIFETIEKLYKLTGTNSLSSPICENDNSNMHISYPKNKSLEELEVECTIKDPQFPFSSTNSSEFKQISKILERIEYHYFSNDTQKSKMIDCLLYFFGYSHLLNSGSVSDEEKNRIANLVKIYQDLYQEDSNGNSFREKFSIHLTSEYMKTKVQQLKSFSSSNCDYLNFLKIIETLNKSDDIPTENGHFLDRQLLSIN